jgi:hypothetical protein
MRNLIKGGAKMEACDILFECCVIRGHSGLHGKRVWGFGVHGPGVEKFCRARDPGWLSDDDGWRWIGPYKTERAARRDLKKTEAVIKEFLQEEFPGLEFKDAPDPRTLS